MAEARGWSFTASPYENETNALAGPWGVSNTLLDWLRLPSADPAGRADNADGSSGNPFAATRGQTGTQGIIACQRRHRARSLRGRWLGIHFRRQDLGRVARD